MRVNLFSGPGVGKSRLASHLNDQLGRDGHHIELVQEVIKPQAYRGEWPSPWGNFQIFSRQLDREREWLESGVTHVVTDSPIFLQCYYMATRNIAPTIGCLQLARDWEAAHPAVNILLRRSPHIEYQQAGRYQDKKEAERVDAGVFTFLRNEGVEFFQFDAHDRPAILEFLREQLGDPHATDQLRKAA